MNWQALQALGELTAAAGVIVSLLYLAAQVRQTTRSIQSAANQDLLTRFSAITEFASQSQFGARLYYKMLRGDWEGMAAEEQTAGRNTWIAALRLFDHAHTQHQAGLLSEDAWNGWSYQVQLTSDFEGFQAVWPSIRPMLSPSFVEWVDSLGGEATRARVEYAQALAEAGFDTSHLDR